MPRIRCECKGVLSYGPELAGQVVECPGCSAKIRLPVGEPGAEPPASAARATLDEGQDLQLEKNEAEMPLAASVPTSEGAAPSGFSLPPSEPEARPGAQRSAAATSDPAAAAQDYWSALPGAFRFPLRGEGLIALIVGVIFVTVAYYLRFMASFPFVGIFLAIGIYAVGAGYFAGYLMTIIERTAHGEKDAPGWPDLTDYQEGALKPFLFVFALGILSLGPCFAYRCFAHEPQPAISYAILAAGLFYLPMGMLCVALANDYAGLSPTRVIRAILSVPGRYFVAWVLVTFSIGAQILGVVLIARLPIPILGTLLQQTVSCYFLFVAARILGLLYYKSGPQLGWLAG